MNYFAKENEMKRKKDLEFLYIPPTMQVVPQARCDALLEKQFIARVWMNSNPFANLMRLKLKRHMTRRNYSNVVYLR